MTGTDDTPAALPRRPDARTFSVEDLVLAVLSGQIRVPNFQRGLKWEPQDALDLLDSIDRGYPIGTLLLWQRPAPAERVVHGSVEIEAPARQDALWVVDGQQRISSLTRILAGKGHPEEPFAAFYDLKTRKFKRLRKRDTPAEPDLPLTEVLDSARLVDWLVAHHDAGVDRQAAIGLGKRLREYQVPAYVVATEDVRTVREIFRRANRTGKRLEDSEVFHALYSHEGPSPASLRDVARSLADLAFGPLDEETLLNMLRATRGTEISKDRVPELQPGEARRAMIDLERCARTAITFLRDDAGIPHISLLPYSQPLLALARFFHRHPEPHPRSRELLARWLWRGAVTGAHTGVAIQTRTMLAVIDGDEHRTLQRLLGTTPERASDVLDLDGYSFGPARCKVQLLALLDLQPSDLRTGELVGLGADEFAEDGTYQKLVRTILPRSAGASGSLADRIIHPAVHTGIASAILACEDPAILASHAISIDARRALKFDQHDKFLRLRGADVLEQVRSFVDRRTEWHEPDTPPVEELLVRGD